MTICQESIPSFNLWTEPWITLEKSDGQLVDVSIQETLLHAEHYLAIYDASPLIVVGIHRLLTAILQDSIDPQENADLEQLWNDEHFPTDKIERFGQQYANRFDIFSQDKPFMQSADLPLFPAKRDLKEASTIAKLFPEIPSGDLITHYRHESQDKQVFCPATAAKGLTTLPAFVSSGGSGLMPSINGVPPIYVLPGGVNLFEKLAASLITAQKLDKYIIGNTDLAWWKRSVPTIVEQSHKTTDKMPLSESRQLSRVGYLHGLTFPARRIRLHPERLNLICSRSNEPSEWCIRTMSFQMGESIQDGVLWQDPFVAYKLPSKRTMNAKHTVLPSTHKKDKPLPVRPTQAKTAWREFTGLFLKDSGEIQRPLFLDQFEEISIGERYAIYPFRCVSFQTDGKMKFFEWADFGFDVPVSLIQDQKAALLTEYALKFADNSNKVITNVFGKYFCRRRESKERDKWLKNKLQENYWCVLAGKFRQFVLDLGKSDLQKEALERWKNTVIFEAQKAFDCAANDIGDDGVSLHWIEESKVQCHNQLIDLRYVQKGD
jgi:CRISPR system Cascade subunit CasA